MGGCSRVTLFNREKDLDSLPPTSDALRLHMGRAYYQTNIWLNATVPSPERLDPEAYGWERDPYSSQLKPKLLFLEPIPKVCTELLQCSCKTCATRKGCKCRGNNPKRLLPCDCSSTTCGIPRTRWMILIQRMSCKGGKLLIKKGSWIDIDNFLYFLCIGYVRNHQFKYALNDL